MGRVVWLIAFLLGFGQVGWYWLIPLAAFDLIRTIWENDHVPGPS